MLPPYIQPEKLRQFIENAFQEDVGSGDHSTKGAVPCDIKSKARLLVKSNGIIAGIEVARLIFQYYDPTLVFEPFKKDGDKVQKGEVAFIVSGNAGNILTCERLVLNCMQRMSGIATKTYRYVQELEGTRTRLLDTRKTTPNFRMLEKWAVHIGGGTNHRFGLFDLIMLKDNHIDFAGSITKAVFNTVEYLKTHNLNLRIEVETRSIEEVKEALATQSVDIIMLDNMPLEMMKEAVAIIDGKALIEASGGITLEQLRPIAEIGVDFISVGALTHSYNSLDLSLKAYERIN
ncbi:MAG: carboxylating nicotinate-nucleotide diphosphorylase [Cytophagales bacterium]|nr:carboxylating nicotinate-nucleotide diphosphorylase [Cytophagales bacterium]MDW8385276.1 carboxylating nicotinate-nucleotide diphosphorylase [Flammeovirgaceae bacterium]